MKTFAKTIGLILLLSLGAFAQLARQPASPSSWSTVPTSDTGSPVVMPSRPGQMQQQQSAKPLNLTPPAVGEIGKVNPLVTTMTSGPVSLGSGDLLEITIFDSPELSARDRVSSNGEI